MIEIMSRFNQGYVNTGQFEFAAKFKCNNNNNNGNNNNPNNNNNIMLPSMTISSESKTPYTDATQVSKFSYFVRGKSVLLRRTA